MSHSTVVLLNPPSGLSRYLRPERAALFVKERKAEWADAGKTRLVLTDQEHRTTLGRCVKALIRREADRGLDGARPTMGFNELKAIPFVGDVRKLLFVRKK
jgi:hypothetical protein